MAIKHVETLSDNATGAAILMVDDVNHEGLYHRCPKTGNIAIKFVEPPIGVNGLLILQDGNNSSYPGQIHKDGSFKP